LIKGVHPTNFEEKNIVR